MPPLEKSGCLRVELINNRLLLDLQWKSSNGNRQNLVLPYSICSVYYRTESFRWGYAMKVKKFVVGVVVVMAGSMLFPVAGSALPGDINESVGDGGIAVINPTDNYDRPIAVAVDSLGRTVIAGQCYNIENQADFCIGRFDQNGNPDTSFSDDGFIVIDMGEAGNYDEPFTVAIDQLNRVVVGGKCYDATGANRSDFCILRLTPSGNLDTSFGGDGVYVDMYDTGSYDTHELSQLIRPDESLPLAGAKLPMERSETARCGLPPLKTLIRPSEAMEKLHIPIPSG